MKIKFLYLIEKIQLLLEKAGSKLVTKKELDELPYHSLSPICEADIPQYEEVLNWTLNNRKEKNIKNIAITGPYGSGKSSILNTFQKQNKNNDLHFLNISLATFKEELDEDVTIQNTNEDEKNGTKTSGEDLIRLIELSILQQIFYHEEDSKIPDSRFKKIKSYNNNKILLWTLGIILSALSFIHIFDTRNLFKIQDICQTHNSVINFIILVIAILVCISSVFVVIYKSIRILTGLKITKLNIKNAEIQINDKINKSILNHHLDEILYFFEVTPYNVVIIEDLDRFQQTEIFTKLREINLLINNSKKIKEKNVVFIYAVRDDMFKDKDRTKFFDFIIPVIPIINSSNSNEILLRKIENNEYQISTDLIEDISLFIDDMRLLHNIINEFHLYHIKLSNKLIQDKLLSIIIYKNIYPNDFVELANNKGSLYETIYNKQKYINIEINRTNLEISQLKEQVKKLDSLKIRDIQELRSIYILKYISKLSNIFLFNINGVNYEFQNVLTDQLFDYFTNDTVKYNHYYYRYNNIYQNNSVDVNIKFKDIEKEVDDTYSYDDRKKLIEAWSNNRSEELKKKIEEYEKEINKIRKAKLKDLLTSKSISIETVDEKQKQLINILLRNGYIDEDYLDYISIFHEGSISKEDHMFMINVKNQISSGFDYKLYKIDKLIEKIKYIDFDKDYFFNYNLIDSLLEKEEYKDKVNQIFSIISNESENSISFIDGYIENGTKIELFIKKLSEDWIDYWKYIKTRSTFTTEKKNLYFRLLNEFAEINDIITISKFSDLKDVISNKKDFLGIIGNKEKLKSIIKTLDIKFNDLNMFETSNEMFDFIYEGNFYKINNHMIALTMKLKGEFNQANFDTKNYYSVLNSKCDFLINYINQHLEEYVKTIYLNIETNISEAEETLIELLNTDKLSDETKAKIITKTTTKISLLGEIKALEIGNLLLKESKVKPMWDNIITHFVNSGNTLSDSVISFINNIEISEELAKTKINKEKPSVEIVKDFNKNIILNERIQNESYSSILKSIPYFYTSLSFENLSEYKVKLLITEKTLGLSPENYNLLRITFEKLHIMLLEIRHSEFIDKISEYNLNQADIISLLNSTEFSNQDKNKIVNTVEDSIIVESIEITLSIAKLILQNNNFDINKQVLMLIFKLINFSKNDKLRIFNIKYSMLDNDDISIILEHLPEPYSKITENGKRPLLDNNEINRELVQILDEKNYISKFDFEDKGIRISTHKNK